MKARSQPATCASFGMEYYDCWNVPEDTRMGAEFLPYKGMRWQARQLSEEAHARVDYEDALIHMVATTQVGGAISDSTLGLAELVHYGLTHKCVNVASPLAERFWNSRFGMSIKPIRLPFSIFEVCFEKGLLVPGTDIQVPSCLVMFKMDEPVLGAMETFLGRAKTLLERLMGMNIGTPLVDRGIGQMFAIKYRDPRVPDDQIATMCHANFHVDQEGTVDEVVENMGLLSHGVMVHAMDDVDKLIQKHVLKLVLGAMFYLNTAHPDVSRYKFHNRPKLGKKSPDAMLLGKTMTRMSPGWHIREGHFRHYQHERFKRNADGTAVVQWIQPTEVNKHLRSAEPAANERHLDA